MINRAGNKEKAKRVLNENGNLSGMVGMEILYRVIAAITSVLLGAMIAGGIGVVSAVVSAPFKLFGLAGIIIAYVLITPIATLVGAIAGGAVAGPFEVARYRYYLSLRKNGIQSLHIRLKDNSEKAGFRSGTTVEAVLFMKGRYYICHVGDCRTYIISDTLTQLTTDHTIVQRELTEGKLTPEQARKDSRQSLLLQCVGAGKDVKPDYLSGEVLPHRTFLICCDGFRRKVTEAEIKKSCRYSSKEKKLHEALEETAQLCMKRKETDNITGILISAVGEKKGLFPLWKKATQTAGKKVIKDILLEHSTPADKIL